MVFFWRENSKEKFCQKHFFRFFGVDFQALLSYIIVCHCPVFYEYSRMGRKIEKRPHDGGGSVTCSIMAWFPLFSLTHTTHWWPRTGRYGIVSKLEPFFCPSKLSDVREGLGSSASNGKWSHFWAVPNSLPSILAIDAK